MRETVQGSARLSEAARLNPETRQRRTLTSCGPALLRARRTLLNTSLATGPLPHDRNQTPPPLCRPRPIAAALGPQSAVFCSGVCALQPSPAATPAPLAMNPPSPRSPLCPRPLAFCYWLRSTRGYGPAGRFKPRPAAGRRMVVRARQRKMHNLSPWGALHVSPLRKMGVMAWPEPCVKMHCFPPISHALSFCSLLVFPCGV